MYEPSKSLIPVSQCGTLCVIEPCFDVVPACASAFERDFVAREFARLTRHAIANGRRAAAMRAREEAIIAYEFDRLTQVAIANGLRNTRVLAGASAYQPARIAA
ncbi:MAG TPA: hypothetical protein VNH44_18305 [Micropepsaceae bacterium]|nr:hypothetical protein [Micropepsaceae bacterium]